MGERDKWPGQVLSLPAASIVVCGGLRGSRQLSLLSPCAERGRGAKPGERGGRGG